MPLLDIENLRTITPDSEPSGAPLTCDVLIVGGGVGGVAAATALLKRGFSVIVTEPTRSVGGQFTSQLVPVPDESNAIERDPGSSTRAYRDLRRATRDHYASIPNVVDGAAANIGQCWVSRVSGTPDIWERLMRDRIADVQALLTRKSLFRVGSTADAVTWADVADLDSGRLQRIRPHFLLDATEDGSALAMAGLPTVVGQEPWSAFHEPHAPDTAHPEWIQSFTYCFTVRWAGQNEPLPRIERPAEYEAFRALGEYTLDYVYSDPPRIVTYHMLDTAPGAAGPFWSYRRLLASGSFAGGVSPIEDIALVNWRGNDFNDETYLDKPVAEQLRVLRRGKAFAQGFLYWLQTECPRDDGMGFGYPEIQPAALPGVGPDGFALHPYVRESRRLHARFTLTENHLLPAPEDPDARWGTLFADSVGCAQYAVDIHPAKGEPHRLARALPYHVPLGAFLTAAGPRNVLPAAKNIGASRLALASARMHPTEWLIGEVSGTLAAICLARGLIDPATVREDPALLSDFQRDLRTAGIALSWAEILNGGG